MIHAWRLFEEYPRPRTPSSLLSWEIFSPTTRRSTRTPIDTNPLDVDGVWIAGGRGRETGIVVVAGGAVVFVECFVGYLCIANGIKEFGGGRICSHMVHWVGWSGDDINGESDKMR